MKETRAVLLITALLLLAGGCSISPEELATGMGNSYYADQFGSAQVPVDNGIAAGSPAVPVGVQGFFVLNFRAKRDEYGRIFVVGEVKNVGKATQGVELQATLRDSTGRVVAVGNFCPAANHSMAPNDVRPFAYSFGRQDEGAQAELRVIRVFYTMDTLGLAALTR